MYELIWAGICCCVGFYDCRKDHAATASFLVAVPTAILAVQFSPWFAVSFLAYYAGQLLAIALLFVQWWLSD